MKATVRFTHTGDEAVKGLPPLCVLDCDWTEVVSKPDGRDDPARVAVRNIFLQKERVVHISVLWLLRSALISSVVHFGIHWQWWVIASLSGVLSES